MSKKDYDQKSEQQKIAEDALKSKKGLPDPAEGRPETRTADEGMNSVPNRDQPLSGALDQEGHRPVLERSRKVR
jgi:hypothetical protein